MIEDPLVNDEKQKSDDALPVESEKMAIIDIDINVNNAVDNKQEQVKEPLNPNTELYQMIDLEKYIEKNRRKLNCDCEATCVFVLKEKNKQNSICFKTFNETVLKNNCHKLNFYGYSQDKICCICHKDRILINLERYRDYNLLCLSCYNTFFATIPVDQWGVVVLDDHKKLQNIVERNKKSYTKFTVLLVFILILLLAILIIPLSLSTK